MYYENSRRSTGTLRYLLDSQKKFSHCSANTVPARCYISRTPWARYTRTISQTGAAEVVRVEMCPRRCSRVSIQTPPLGRVEMSRVVLGCGSTSTGSTWHPSDSRAAYSLDPQCRIVRLVCVKVPSHWIHWRRQRRLKIYLFARPALGTFEVFGRTGPSNLGGGGANFGILYLVLQRPPESRPPVKHTRLHNRLGVLKCSITHLQQTRI